MTETLAEWWERAPSLARECAESWSLRLGEPYPGSNMALVVPAERPDGSPAVLKVASPGDEPLHEAEALACWDGRGAVRLLDRDDERGALLLERCEPGTLLARTDREDDVLREAVGLLRRLWAAPPAQLGLPRLRDDLERWAEELPLQWERLGRPFERALVEEALAAVRELPDGEEVVLHGDFHSGNVLRAQREPWLAIDPIPRMGDRAFDAASLLRDRRFSVTGASLRRRLDVLAGALGLERDRLRRWGLVHALFWGVSWAKLEEDMVLAAELLRR